MGVELPEIGDEKKMTGLNNPQIRSWGAGRGWVAWRGAVFAVHGSMQQAEKICGCAVAVAMQGAAHGGCAVSARS